MKDSAIALPTRNGERGAGAQWASSVEEIPRQCEVLDTSEGLQLMQMSLGLPRADRATRASS